MILVTGGKGFIGAAVALELDHRGLDGVTFDHPNDVTGRDSVFEVVGHVDGVINLAGRLGTSETFGDETATALVNIVGALHVADACRQFDIPMVQIGTGHKGQPNPYAITKGCVEDLLLGRAQVTGQKINVVRAFHVYGPGQKACAPHGVSPVRKIMPSFACRALTGMPVEVTGDGSQLIDLVYVDEVAAVLVDALNGPWGQTLEAGSGIAMSVLDVARDIVERCGSKSPITCVPMRPGEPAGAKVVAERPLCKGYPYMIDETIDYYRRMVHS